MPDKTIHILFASRLVREKGVDILMEAIKKIDKNERLRNRIISSICSDGLYEWEIRELEKKYKNVKYYGKVPPEKMRELYREADFLFMPSRFLETFWLTALESLACGTPVIGFQKGGLTPLISDPLVLDIAHPVDSLTAILIGYLDWEVTPLQDISRYSKDIWIWNLEKIFEGKNTILIIHDYDDLIWWAEYYVESQKQALLALGKKVEIFSYHGKTTSWKRRWMFICSVFAFWRGFALSKKLQSFHPDSIIMHSVLRYIWPWGMRSIGKYTSHSPDTSLFLSHHDVGLLAPFPQEVYEESDIPADTSLSTFLRKTKKNISTIPAFFKWFYIRLLLWFLPKNTEHIIFSPFLEEYIRAHFRNQKVILFPHSVDREIFHP